MYTAHSVSVADAIEGSSRQLRKLDTAFPYKAKVVEDTLVRSMHTSVCALSKDLTAASSAWFAPSRLGSPSKKSP